MMMFYGIIPAIVIVIVGVLILRLRMCVSVDICATTFNNVFAFAFAFAFALTGGERSPDVPVPTRVRPPDHAEATDETDGQRL